jgi:hypothetical protein
VRVWKLKWGLGNCLGSQVGHRRERKCEFIGGANGGGGGLRGLLGRTRGKKRDFLVFSGILESVPKVLGWHWRSKGN